MSPSLDFEVETKRQDDQLEIQYQKGVKHLCDSGGLTRIPNKYVLAVPDRPNTKERNTANLNLKLPVIDFAQLQGSNRSQAINSLSKACEEYGFFQVINHGIPCEAINSMIDVSQRFFKLPYEERAKFMSADMHAPVRYGTSFNQKKDGVFCWRDFLKLMCHPLPDVLPYWPASPVDLRQAAVTYSKQTNCLFLLFMEAILESLGLVGATKNEAADDDDDILNEFKDGSQLMIINCFPSCPEPDLTLGMPPHSDYGLLTLVAHDDVHGLQIQHEGKWVTVESLPNSLVINVGDHLEIFSNGRYKSVLHRVLVNSLKSRISVATLHSLPLDVMVRPASKLVNEANPRRYKDTDFASFLEYISSQEPKKKNFLETRKLT